MAERTERGTRSAVHTDQRSGAASSGGRRSASQRPSGGGGDGQDYFYTFQNYMRSKLMMLFVVFVAGCIGLSAVLIHIAHDTENASKRSVLYQQSYDSVVIPFRRGGIVDRNGTVLASSTLTYNVIVEAKTILSDEAYLAPTLSALGACFDADTEKLLDYIRSNPDSYYYVLAKNVPYGQKLAFDEMVAAQEKGVDNIQGVRFEEAYVRNYPNGSLASTVLGFSGTGNSGSYGLEQYYNNILNGTPGRTYGYIHENTGLQRTTISATDGNGLVLTLDANIQSIVEKYLRKYCEEHTNEAREGNGARNLGCIVMDVKTGGILAMADYPTYDLNNPDDISLLVGMNEIDFENGEQPTTDQYLTADEVANLSDYQKAIYLNALWKNFCISDAYEPGSTAKPFTVAAGLESGAVQPGSTYVCEGSLTVAEDTEPIKCHNTYGDGLLTVGEAVERSCNVALMKMAFAEGKETFSKFQNVFNFGLRTNIDLANETRTDATIIKASNMSITDLATNSFGQNFDVTMIQMAAGFASLINGGNYYQPYIVSRITSPSGATVRNIEPRVIKKTVSEETSALIRQYCHQVVVGPNGTGKTARPAGYMIGGKTGTAETHPRNMGQYVVSFIGFAPVEDPEVLIYVVVDRPNVWPQDDAKNATGIVRNILTEILPYMGFPMTEPLSEAEQAELQALADSGAIAMGAGRITELLAPEEETPEGGETAGEAAAAPEPAPEEAPAEPAPEEPSQDTEAWRDFPVDPETGFLVDPNTGALVDPETGHVYDTSSPPEAPAENAEAPAETPP